MGQAQSGEQRAPPSHEEVSQELAHKFAQKCFTSLELYSLKDVFRSLADHEGSLRYLKEDTVARFLEIPDILGASPVVFQMVSYIGAFPFLQDAPAVLGLEQMIMVITIMTERYRRILAKGAADRRKLLFNSLAVYDRKLSQMASGVEKAEKEADGQAKTNAAAGFAVDEPGEEDDAETPDEEDDELVLAAFASVDYIDAFKTEGRHSSHGAMIPADNFRKLVMLLLLVAPLGPQESIAVHAARLMGDELESLRSTAECVLAAFLNVETSPGIRFGRFNTVVPAALPYLFSGFNNLFERFLFSKNLDFTKHKDEGAKKEAKPAPSDPSKSLHIPVADIPQPLLQDQGSIMNLNILSQLSFFLPGSSLFRRLRLLYSGDNDGFSMGSFESKVFNWRAPTLLLVRGTRLQEDSGPGYHPPAGSSAETAFVASLPPRRFPSGRSKGAANGGDQLIFGVYVGEPWRHTHREAFGGDDTTLFQLEPTHDVFHASSSGSSADRVTFSKPSPATAHPGVAFGCPPSSGNQSTHHRHHHTSSLSTSASGLGLRDLGPVSLVLDSSFEFGCFTHDYFHSRGGTAFGTSSYRKCDFQERFAVEALEIWGCGGDEEAKVQAERWAWEAREAEARRRINLGTGDVEADRALLEMAGLIGAGRSGGSMG